MTPEWSRPECIDTIGEGERAVAITADEGERQALAHRFGLVAIARLDAHFTVRRDAAGVIATGRVTADVTQACSITDDPLYVTVDEPVALRFVEAMGDGDDIELDEGEMDTVPIEAGAIDLGEAAAETVALALDPYPRGPGAAAALKAAGVIGDDEVVPTGPLAGLKDKLAGR